MRLWLVVIVCVAGVFWLRYQLFGNFEPRADASYFSTCVRDLVSANRILPDRTVTHNFWRALETDDKTVLYAIGRPVYGSPQLAFSEIPFLVESAIMAVIGYSYSHIVVLSILASALILLPLTLLFSRCIQSTALSGITCALLYASSAYPMLFSPWGIHHWAILALITFAAVVTPLFADPSGWRKTSRHRILILGGLTLVTAYTHHTNVILVPVATVLALAGLPGLAFKKKIPLIALYGLIVSIGLVPAGLLSLALGKTYLNFGTFANVGSSPGNYLEGILPRAEQWIVIGAHLFSVPGLFLGMLGITWMALVTPLKFPFWLLVTHIICYCLIPGFIWSGNNTYLRTYNYAIPLLALGLAWLLLHVMKPVFGGPSGIALRFGVGILVIWHLAVQVPSSSYAEWAKSHAPDFVVDYLDGQGNLRPIVADLERRAQGQPILFWSNDPEWLYLPLAGGTANVARSSVSAVFDKRERGADTGIDLPEEGYLIATDAENEKFSTKSLASSLQEIHGRPSTIKLIATYPSSVPLFGTFLLYRVEVTSE